MLGHSHTKETLRTHLSESSEHATSSGINFGLCLRTHDGGARLTVRMHSFSSIYEASIESRDVINSLWTRLPFEENYAS
jgi:hypothetical protein